MRNPNSANRMPEKGGRPAEYSCEGCPRQRQFVPVGTLSPVVEYWYLDLRPEYLVLVPLTRTSRPSTGTDCIVPNAVSYGNSRYLGVVAGYAGEGCGSV